MPSNWRGVFFPWFCLKKKRSKRLFTFLERIEDFSLKLKRKKNNNESSLFFTRNMHFERNKNERWFTIEVRIMHDCCFGFISLFLLLLVNWICRCGPQLDSSKCQNNETHVGFQEWQTRHMALRGSVKMPKIWWHS